MLSHTQSYEYIYVYIALLTLVPKDCNTVRPQDTLFTPPTIAEIISVKNVGVIEVCKFLTLKEVCT